MSDIRIACVGDIMCGDSFYAMGQGVAASLKRWGNVFLDNEIVSYLKGHDITLCNIECVLSNIGANRYSLKKTQMRGRPENAEVLHNWGFNVANVANNHILEHGLDAATDTVRNLKAAGIKVVGAGENEDFGEGIKEVQLSLQGHNIAIFGICLRDEKYAYCKDQWGRLLTKIQELTRQNVAVLVSIHWGDELIDRPNLSIKDRARQLRDAGAVIVAGHHPHVVQGVEENQGQIVAYSLGNFIFNGFLPDTCWSIILSLTLSGNRVKDWTYRIVEKDQDHRPHFCDKQRLLELDSEMQRRITLLKESQTSNDYEQEYRRELLGLKKEASKSLRKLLRKRFWSYAPVFWPQILMRPIKRRLGIW